jgi:RNA polymerase sigma-70 factor, ECF subfamily
LDEKYLIEHLKKQDKIVFDFIFNYYYSGLCVYAKQYAGSIEAAEDIVQDFFVHLWLKASFLTIESSLKAYLFTSIKNRCLDQVKHNQIKEKFRKSVLQNAEESENDNFNKYVEAELREAINKSLEKLAPRCREVFNLSRFEGKTNQEIADQLGLSKRTVELQISNALQVLRVELKNYLPACLVAFIISR